MSGPIVRKYGFPNFEQIFGKRELEHGADEEEAPEPEGEGTKTSGESGSEKTEDRAPTGAPRSGSKPASA